MLYWEVLDYLEDMSWAFVREFIPPYLCSAACHAFNIFNYSKDIYHEHGHITDMRLHMFFISSPGFSKSSVLKMLLDGPTSIFYGTKIQTAFMAILTEAAFTGTIRVVDGEVQEVPGAAKEYRTSIVGVEEFDALIKMMQQEHSGNLDNALLTALDNGWVRKRLAAGPISYMTHLTLWAASQPLRFDLTSGLARRFMFIYFIPDKEAQQEIREKRREGSNVRPDRDRLNKIKDAIDTKYEKLRDVIRIEFDDSVRSLIDRLNIPHYEEPLYERLALGYNISAYDFDREITVTLDNELRRLIEKAYLWRKQVKIGADYSQILVLLSDGKPVPHEEILEQMLTFGVPYDQTSNLINRMIKAKMIVKIIKEGKIWYKIHPSIAAAFSL